MKVQDANKFPRPNIKDSHNKNIRKFGAPKHIGIDIAPNIGNGALFQLGKDVQTSMQYRMYIPSMTTTHLGGTSGTLSELRTMTFETDAEKETAYAIVNEAINMVAKQRGTIGAVQKGVIENSAKNLDIQLEKVSEAEGLISNVDMALESARLSRAELLAQSAKNSILYARGFEQYLFGLFM